MDMKLKANFAMTLILLAVLAWMLFQVYGSAEMLDPCAVDEALARLHCRCK